MKQLRLKFERVRDGVIVSGLKPGLMAVEPVDCRDWKRWADDGNLWPYRLRLVPRTDPRTVVFAVELDPSFKASMWREATG